MQPILSKIITSRDFVVKKLTGFDLRSINVIRNEIVSLRHEIEDFQHKLQENYIASEGLLKNLRDINLAQRDDIPRLREKLFELRKTKKYKDAFVNNNPLITVRIASYNKTDDLIHTAIASVLKQTYQNFEIIVVNDGPNEATRKAIERLKDKRIRYYEFPFRNIYPDDDKKRWMVAGSPGMNMGANLAKGDWIAPLDDDDEFTDDHLETLLKGALDGKFELFYGSLTQINTTSKKEYRVWDYPPKLGYFSLQGAIYLSQLDFLNYDQKSYLYDEPADWNLCRRMIETGVRIGAIDKKIGVMYTTPLEER